MGNIGGVARRAVHAYPGLLVPLIGVPAQAGKGQGPVVALIDDETARQSEGGTIEGQKVGRITVRLDVVFGEERLPRACDLQRHQPAQGHQARALGGVLPERKILGAPVLVQNGLIGLGTCRSQAPDSDADRCQHRLHCHFFDPSWLSQRCC
ncbi:hypothetical protein D9M71_554870 [compost metagenome]